MSTTPQVIWFEFPGLPQVRCAFQTRQGGFSAPPYNDGNISLTVGDDPEAVIRNRKALDFIITKVKVKEEEYQKPQAPAAEEKKDEAAKEAKKAE